MSLRLLEVEDFKSYKGKQRIGPFHNFTSVIGPNGCGKSNLMDAISFVLGVKSNHLRSKQLKDLIYKPNPTYLQNSDYIAPVTASVSAYYKTSDGSELVFSRIITPSSTSEYKINGKTCSWVKYNSALEQENILVKARNFLVFQGDVEQIASQSPSDLTKLIEQISGSLDLKPEYDQLKTLQEKATETSTHNFNRKREINAEMKSFREQKEELAKYEKLTRSRDKKVKMHLLWKLFHMDKKRRELLREIEAEKEKVDEIDGGQKQLVAQQREAAKLHAKATKESLKLEKTLKELVKQGQEMKPEQVKLQTQLQHITKKLTTLQTNLTQAETQSQTLDATIKKYESDLAGVQKASRLYEEEVKEKLKAAHDDDKSVDDEGVEQYHKLKQQVSTQTAVQKQALLTHTSNHLSLTQKLSSYTSETQESTLKKTTLLSEKARLTTRKEALITTITEKTTLHKQLQKDLDTLEKQRLKLNQKETETTEKLNQITLQLSTARTSVSIHEKRKKYLETLDALKRLFPGVHGRMMDLCSPSAKKYETSVGIVLGKNMDSIVVDNFEVGKRCLEYFKDQKSGSQTFIPLDTIQTKPIPDHLRTIHPHAKLAIDCINFDTIYERAFVYACSNTLITDSSDTAKQINYERGNAVKCVTLDGTVFHKAGLITGGGMVNDGGKRWEEKECEGLKKVREGLLVQVMEIRGERRTGGSGDAVRERFSGLGREIRDLKDDLNGVQSRLNSVEAEVLNVEKEVSKKAPEIKKINDSIEAEQIQIEKLNQEISSVQDEIFSEFCEAYGFDSISEYEVKQVQVDAKVKENRSRYSTQIVKLENLLEFEREQFQQTQSRINTLQTSITKLLQDQKTTQTAITEQNAQEDQHLALLESKQTAKIALSEKLKQTLDALNALKKQDKTLLKKYEESVNSISTKEAQVEFLYAEKLAVFRKCQLEEIPLPLLEGSVLLDELSLDGLDKSMVDEDAMDESEGPTGKMIVDGIKVDYSSLSRELKENQGEEVDFEFIESLKEISSEIEKLVPNMKAIDKLDDVENKLRETAQGFDHARKEAKEAKEKFNAIKQERHRKFHEAYTHISNKIDTIYKELTASKTFPMGGSAYLSLEDTDEPYLDGVKYHAMPPMKRFRDMDQLSGGEKTVAALALLFAIHSYRPSPFFILDEVDAALDNTNVTKVANYIRKTAMGKDVQFIVISLKSRFYEKAEGLVGICRDGEASSRVLTLLLEGKFQ